ncbi:MAG TPA: glycosyltransferase [Acidobacteriota bacterium]|nr:glycosyltransferase [Acidobacteriota bacterium]
MKKAVFTIVARNYLHFARSLMRSVARVHPELARFVVLLDGRADEAGLDLPADFETIGLERLRLPSPKRFLFRYNLLEMSTAVKPWAFENLLADEGFDQVVYLDPDIHCYQPMTEAFNRLDAGEMMVLTPHLTGRLDDERHPGELQILQSGAFNLGFLALARQAAASEFVDWWKGKLERHCTVDIRQGLFVDQKWIDLVPGLFPGIHILRHPGYNVAYWNLNHRPVSRRAGGLRANGAPLIFFHFSGFCPFSRRFSKHQNRFSLNTLSAAAQELVENYRKELIAQGADRYRKIAYAYDRFDNGAQIHQSVRRFYRSHPEVEKALGEDPFKTGPDYFGSADLPAAPGRPLVTKLMRAVWENREDLRRCFPDLKTADRVRYAHWFVGRSAKEESISPCFVEPVRASLAADQNVARKITWEDRIRNAYLGAKTFAAPASLWIPTGLKSMLRRHLEPRLLPGFASIGNGSGGFRPASVEGHGFHTQDRIEIARGVAWMGRRAVVELPDNARGAIVIEGIHDRGNHRREGGNGAVKITVSAGNRRKTAAVKWWGRFELTFELGELAEAGEIVLEADRTFVPKELGMGEDARELSIQVRRIRVGKQVLVDFRAVPDAHAGGATVKRGGLNIVGYLRTATGVGESARNALAAAQAARLGVAIRDVSDCAVAGRVDEDAWGSLETGNPYFVSLFHINADETVRTLRMLGQGFCQGRYNIGFWHWELPQFPDKWRDAFDHLDEVWAPSEFVERTLRGVSPVPVFRLPHAVWFDPPSGVPRAKFGLPENRFLYLTMCDCLSVPSRKNPKAVIEAYCRAFPRPAGTGLIIKLQNSGRDPAARKRLAQMTRGRDDIHLLDATLSRHEAYALESVCDCYVSLHRSEGFGLPIAECMYLSKPVIATAWSGNVDFMDEGNSCPVDFELIELARDVGPYPKGSTWADPDVSQAAFLMRRVLYDARFRQSIARQAGKDIRKRLSPKAVGRLYWKHLRRIEKEFF